MKEKNEHTFVICAYKDSPYIEDCIISLKNQTISSIIMLVTATPSPYLQEICERYQIKYFVREGSPNIADDWNYALSVACTPYVTIAHQDDIYEKNYAHMVMTEFQQQKRHQVAIAFTDYSELVDGIQYPNRTNLLIKRFLLMPLKYKNNQGKILWRRHVIRFGNAIGCPTVTYNKEYIEHLLKKEGRDNLFSKHFRSNLDWEAWEWLSRREGTFLYIPVILMAHRIHGDSETTAIIHDRQRGQEDYSMFCKFWPEWVARLITKVYGNSEKTNEV